MRGKIFIALGIVFLSLSFMYAAEVNYPSEVSITIFNIIYDKFDSNSTNFSSFNESELGSLSNVILEILPFGKIEFLENLDVVSMGGINYIVDFNSYLNISDNLIVADLDELPGINKAAILTLHGITFTDPIIYTNGEVCLSCTQLSYVNGTFIFTVTDFDGAFYLRENPDLPVCGDSICNGDETLVSCPSDCEETEPEEPATGGGGGGGGGGSSGGGSGGGSSNTTDDDVIIDPYAGIYDFAVTPTLLDSRVRKGTYFKKEIMVENNGSKDISIGVSVLGLEEFIFPQVNSFNLAPGQIKSIRFDIYVSNSQAAGVYMGEVKFSSRYRSRSADFVLQVKEKEALFDIRTEVLKKYVNPGGRVRANVSLINMGDLRNFDVNLDYMIIDFDKNNYSLKSEQLAINQTYSNIFFLDVPEDIPLGNYIFYTVVSVGDVTATSYDTFTTEKISFISWVILMIIVIVLMYLAVRWYRKRRKELILKALKESTMKSQEANASSGVKGVEETMIVKEVFQDLP